MCELFYASPSNSMLITYIFFISKSLGPICEIIVRKITTATTSITHGASSNKG